MLRDANAFSGFAVDDLPRAKGIHRTLEVHPVALFRDPAGKILSIIEE